MSRDSASWHATPPDRMARDPFTGVQIGRVCQVVEKFARHLRRPDLTYAAFVACSIS